MTREITIWSTIAIYSIIMLAVGIINSKSTKTLASFTVGKRNAGAWLTALSYGTAYFSAVMFIGYSGRSGWDFGLWAVLIGLGNAIFGSYFAWKVLASKTRTVSHHYHIKSMPQLFEIRYLSRGMKLFSSIVIFLFLLPYSASVYKGLTSVCSILLGVDETVTMIIIAIASAVLLFLGGYLATIKADFVQGIIMMFGVALLIYFMLTSPTVKNGGGFSGMVKIMDDIGLVKMNGTKWTALVATILMTSFGTWGLPQMIHKYYGVKDEHEIKRGTVISTLFAVLVAGGGYLIGGFSHMFFKSDEQMLAAGGIDSIVPNMLNQSFLPNVLLGIVLVLLISASVSTLSAITMSACSTVTIDIVKPACGQKLTDRHMALLIRIFCIIFVILSYLVANTDTPILDMMSYSWGILSGSFLAPYLLALYYKGMTRAGAWWGTLSGFAVAFVPAGCKILTLIDPNINGAVKNLAGKGPHFAVIAIIASFAICFISSFASRKTGSPTNVEFYEKAGI